jgi:type 1 glutamine amidotransferase
MLLILTKYDFDRRKYSSRPGRFIDDFTFALSCLYGGSMIYTNMGHGNKIFTSPRQNLFFENALLWLGQ